MVEIIISLLFIKLESLESHHTVEKYLDENKLM